MKYIALDIKVGGIGKKAISTPRLEFHANVAKMLFPKDNEHICLEPKFSVPLDYQEISNEPDKIKSILDNTFDENISSNSPVELYIIDFSSNSFDLPREPLLIHLWVKLGEYFKKMKKLKFLVLFKNLPSLESVSHSFFNSLGKNAGNNTIILLDDSGSYIKCPKNIQKISISRSAYKRHVTKLYKSPLYRLKNKLVRRLGNFPQSKYKKDTRFYSYLIDNCENELVQLIKNWWKKSKLNCDAVIYDSPNIESLSFAVRIFATEFNLPIYRIEDLMNNGRKLLSLASKHKKCLLILDVVGTGNTLLNYNDFLEKNHISLSHDVLTAINKGGAVETNIVDFKVNGFLAVEEDPPQPIQIQRELSLPMTSDNYEVYDKLRAFDFWYMAYDVGWEPETDVPENIGLKYDIVPKFTKILTKYGDWIAYKMEQFLKKINHPQNFFVIHPDESGAIAVSDKLQLRFNRLTIIKIPRRVIKQAQEKSNNWHEILLGDAKNEDWFIELSSIKNASGLITDVFNASGSTFLSIFRLLEHLQIAVFCYFPFIDRDCHPKDIHKYPIAKYSLYDWFGPRKLILNGNNL